MTAGLPRGASRRMNSLVPMAVALTDATGSEAGVARERLKRAGAER